MDLETLIPVISLLAAIVGAWFRMYQKTLIRLTQIESKVVELEKKYDDLDSFMSELQSGLTNISINQAATLAEIKTILKFIKKEP